MHHANFRALKDSTFDKPVHRARGGRTDMMVAGNGDVFREAEGEEDYARGDERRKGRRVRRKSGGKVQVRMAGGDVRARLDRPNRRSKKLADGGAADDDAVVSGDIPRRPTQSDDDDSATAKLNQPEDIRGDDRLPSALDRFFGEFQGTKPAYRSGGRTKKFADGGAADDKSNNKSSTSFSDVTKPEPTADEVNTWRKILGTGLDDLSGSHPAYRKGGQAKRSQRRK